MHQRSLKVPSTWWTWNLHQLFLSISLIIVWLKIEYYISLANGHNTWILSKPLTRRLHHTLAITGGSRISQGERQPQRGSQPIVWPIFTKQCLKWRNFEPEGSWHASLAPRDLPLLAYIFTAFNYNILVQCFTWNIPGVCVEVRAWMASLLAEFEHKRYFANSTNLSH